MADTPGYVSNAVLAQRISTLVDRWNTRENQMIALLTQAEGSVTVTDGIGANHILPSFPQLSADVSELVDELTGAVAQTSDQANTARLYAESAQASSTDSGESADRAAESAQEAGASADAASAWMDAAAESATAAEQSANASALSASAGASSASDADEYATQAADSRQKALASENAAAAKVIESSAFADDSQEWSDKSRQWATTAPGVEVEDGLFSARHWANQAQASVAGALVYMGTWDASSGVYPVTPAKGHFWKVGTAGTVEDTSFSVGDQIVYNGTSWDKIDNSDQVTSVAGRMGDVTLTTSDIGGLGALAVKSKASYLTDLVDLPTSFPPGTHSHTKGDVGLSNVDNTSDANKPVSTAQQAALNAKATNGADARFKDIFADRGDGTGAFLFGAAGAGRYLYWNGTDYKFGGNFTDFTALHTGNFNPASKADAGHTHGSTYIINDSANVVGLGWLNSELRARVDATTWNLLHSGNSSRVIVSSSQPAYVPFGVWIQP